MPYKTVYYPAPKDESLPVQKKLPPTAHTRIYSFLAMDLSGAPVHQWTLCKTHCGGWIPKEPFEARVNTLDGRRLCGRRGIEWYCPRCGSQIHFEGMVS